MKITITDLADQTGESVTTLELNCLPNFDCTGGSLRPNVVIPGVGEGAALVNIFFRSDGTISKSDSYLRLVLPNAPDPILGCIIRIGPDLVGTVDLSDICSTSQTGTLTYEIK
jgi:hypothetical protein